MRPEDFAVFTRRVAEGADVDWDRAEAEAADARQRDLIRQLRALHEHGARVPAAVGARWESRPEPDTRADTPALWAHLRVLSPIRRGPDGETLRAWDTRLERQVTLKLLRIERGVSAERESRLLDEAKRLARIRHPNVVTVYGADRDAGRVGLWMETIEGETLEDLLRQFGRFSPGETALAGLTLCRALSAVHGAGLVHGDITAENVTRELGGRLVLTGMSARLPIAKGDSSPTYHLAPEILRGQPPTVQSDIYALGVLLFRLLTAQHPVEGRVSDQVKRVFLHDVRPDVPDGIANAIERALSVDPADRYRTTGEMEAALAASMGLRAQAPPIAPAARPSVWWLAIPLAVAALAAIAIALTRDDAPAQPTFQRLTFRHGRVLTARFVPDGQTILYSAEWSGGPREIFSNAFGSLDSRSLEVRDASVLAVSRRGELALLLKPRFLRGYVESGTLARVSLGGGTPRELLADVQEADWSPDGNTLAVVRDVGGRTRVEYPLGTAIYETGGWVSHIRISPDGEALAFIDHPVPADDSGSITIVGRAGTARRLTGRWVSAQGLAWAPDGREVWFTASGTGNARALHAVALDGRQRVIHAGVSRLRLHDIARDGRALVTEDSTRVGIMGVARGEQRERDLSWLDWSLARDISTDGRLLLLNESGEGGGSRYGVYLRPMDGGAAVRLGDGSGMAISNDGQWVLATTAESPSQLVLLPTGAGQPRVLPRGSNRYQQWGAWFADGRRVLFAGNEPGGGSRLYVQRIDGGAPRAITSEGVYLTSSRPIAPNDSEIAAVGPDQRLALYPADGGPPRAVAGVRVGEVPIAWTPDGRALLVWQRGEAPARISAVDILTGARTRWKDLVPADPTGVHEILRIVLSGDAQAYAYSYTRELSALHVMDGVR